MKLIKQLITAAAVLATSTFFCISVNAETSVDTTTTIPISSTQSEETTLTSTSAETTIPVITSTVTSSDTTETTTTTPVSSSAASEETEPEEAENPFTSGMLADDVLYEYMTDYLDEDAWIDMGGSAVLVDESTLNKDSEEETDENSDELSEESTSGEKIMYTVATRDGSTFYIIIDKSGSGENVYFLNKVDIVDLASLIETGDSDEENTLSPQEKAIISQATGLVITEGSTPEDENTDNDAENGDESDNSDNNTETTTPANKSDTTLYIIVGVGAVLAVIIGWYFKVGPGKKKNATFDEDEDEDDEQEEGNFVRDEPIEDDYEEDTDEE